MKSDEPREELSDGQNPHAPQAGEPHAPESPFAALAQRRAEMGLTLEDVAHHLKFARRQIESLEAGDFLRLPTGTFVRGMLRSYARLLKLDPAPMLAVLGERASASPLPEQAVVLPDSVPFADGTRHVNLPYLLFSLGVLIAVSVLAFEWMHDGGGAAKLAFVPAAETPPAPQPPPAAQTMVSSIAATPVSVATEPPAQAETGPSANPAPAPAPAAGQHRINLSFERESWVEITDRAGRRLISQLNPAGSERAIDGEPPFDVIVGNAQYVKLTYDHRPIDLMPYVKVEVARFTLE
jgi:cytoskeleton protein RodZ